MITRSTLHRSSLQELNLIVSLLALDRRWIQNYQFQRHLVCAQWKRRKPSGMRGFHRFPSGRMLRMSAYQSVCQCVASRVSTSDLFSTVFGEKLTKPSAATTFGGNFRKIIWKMAPTSGRWCGPKLDKYHRPDHVVDSQQQQHPRFFFLLCVSSGEARTLSTRGRSGGAASPPPDDRWMSMDDKTKMITDGMFLLFGPASVLSTAD